LITLPTNSLVYRLSRAARLIIFAAAGVCLSLMIGGIFDMTTPARAETVRISPVFSAGGAARVGGRFALTNHLGERVSSDDFRGKKMLVYFGYTFCPDICAGELQKIADALDRLGNGSAKLQPIFITLDPERDTVKVLADYVSHFHRNMIGLTGTPEEIQYAAKAYRVLYQRSGSISDTDYLIGHSSNVFLMDENGEYAAHFPYGSTVEEMVAVITRHLAN